MKVIEFFGMPKAGKTTAIEIAESYLKKEGKNVRVIYEGARVSPLDKKDRFLYNSWSFHNTLNRLLESRLDHYDFILIDRGVYDHIAFGRAIKELCPKHDLEITEEYYRQFCDLEEHLFLYMIGPEESIAREKKNNLFLGRVFSEPFLNNLHGSYEDLYNETIGNKNIYLFHGDNLLKYNACELISLLENSKVNMN